MIKPLDIATEGFLCGTLGVASSGYICVYSTSPSRFNSTFFHGLGYDINDVIIVRKRDIKVRHEGSGIIMSYYGNRKHFCVQAKNLSLLNKTREDLVCDFVVSLNHKPIMKPHLLNN